MRITPLQATAESGPRLSGKTFGTLNAGRNGG